MSESRTYERAVEALANILFSISHHVPGEPGSFTHANENNLDEPCRLLERLGVMTDHQVAHAFVIDWVPGQPLPIVRKPEEPTLDEVNRALAFFVRWFPEDMRNVCNDEIPDPEARRYDTDFKTRLPLRRWAVRRAAKCLEEQGLGKWHPQSGFRLVSHGEEEAT